MNHARLPGSSSLSQKQRVVAYIPKSAAVCEGMGPIFAFPPPPHPRFYPNECACSRRAEGLFSDTHGCRARLRTRGRDPFCFRLLHTMSCATRAGCRTSATRPRTRLFRLRFSYFRDSANFESREGFGPHFLPLPPWVSAVLPERKPTRARRGVLARFLKHLPARAFLGARKGAATSPALGVMMSSITRFPLRACSTRETCVSSTTRPMGSAPSLMPRSATCRISPEQDFLLRILAMSGAASAGYRPHGQGRVAAVPAPALRRLR
jgi:hypothetical protein